MALILGLDFGNYYAQLCCIVGMDERTRRGGTCYDLQDPNSPNPNGIPNVFYYSSSRYNGQELFGHQAERARPVENARRYMKRNLGATTVVDGKEFNYDDIIVKMVEYDVRLADRQLRAERGESTNLVSLAYPASYHNGRIMRLKELVERATLEDGTHLKVIGTIQEPAAAALDYAAEHPGTGDSLVVWVYDYGGGTFDASVVEAYPNGRRIGGKEVYYNVRWTNGLENVGGRECDKVMYNLFCQKAGFTPKGATADRWMNMAEACKRELSYSNVCEPELMTPDGEYLDITITLEEYERALRPLIQRTIDLLKKAHADPSIPKPDRIVLTGGASQMPIVRKMLEENFRQYRDRIVFHRPSKAIAYGAARFGTDEQDTDPTTPTGPVIQRTTHDIGVAYLRGAEKTRYVYTFIPAGTVIPFTSKEEPSWTVNDDVTRSRFVVYEANCANPVDTQIDRDYHEIIRVVYDHGRKVPKGKESRTQLTLDKNNILHISVTDPDAPNKPALKNSCEYKNLATKESNV